MEQNRFDKLMKILSNVTEEISQGEYEIIVLLFKSFFLNKENISSPKELWFENEEIKNAQEYYQAITLLIDSFIKYCDNKMTFQAKLFSKEVNDIFKNNKFSVSYDCLIK